MRHALNVALGFAADEFRMLRIYIVVTAASLDSHVCFCLHVRCVTVRTHDIALHVCTCCVLSNLLLSTL